MQLLRRGHSRIERVFIEAPAFPHQAANTVTFYRFFKLLFGNGKTHPGRSYILTARNKLIYEPDRKNRKRFPITEKRINMLLALEPLVCFESMTNGEIVLKGKIISGGAHLTQSASYGLFCGEKPILYDRLQIAYAYGNHVLSYGAYGVADTYVSYFILLAPIKTGMDCNFYKGSAKVG